MAGFRKAPALKGALKIAFYGRSGSGKTFTALLVAEGLARLTGKRIAFIDTEAGSGFYRKHIKERIVHKEAFDFDVLTETVDGEEVVVRSLTIAAECVRQISPDDYCVVVVDSVTHFWEAAKAAYRGKTTKTGQIPFHAWGPIKKPYKAFLTYMLNSPMHLILCGREGTMFEEDEQGDTRATGPKMKAEGETPYETDFLFRLESVRLGSTGRASRIEAYAEKDRSGVLAGRSFTLCDIGPGSKPPSSTHTFDTLIAPLLGLLEGPHGKVQTEEDAAKVDAEAISEEDMRHVEESENLRADYEARITLCKSVDELKAVGKELTPAVKKRMTTADVGGLKEAYLARQASL